ncbi:MAG: thioredoxin domain-containing protein, partial [Rhodococcus ruber]|nr:thioredoxin domain-containing protein [Rhodococcus ruber]
YGDYECPYCGRAYPIIKRVQERFGERLRFVFRNFPLAEIHPHALHAAEAAESVAARGGEDAFWAMHDLIFEHQRDLGDALLGDLAAKAGADAAAVLVEMARITRPGGRIVALTLNPTSPWGWIDRPTRRAPYSAARYVSRRELRRLGGRHGRAQVRGRLFTAARFGHRLEPIAALPGRIVPWFGAVQMLVVDREL